MKGISQSIKVLKEEVSSILTVSEWARYMEYDDTKKFTRHFRKYFQQNPKVVIITEHLNNLSELIEKYPEDKFLAIAWRGGFRDDNALREFVRRHTGRSLTEFKRMVLNQH